MDTGVILAVVVVNAMVRFVQKSHAEGALTALAALAETTATVVRSGERRSIRWAGVVTGNLVMIEAGARRTGAFTVAAKRRT